MLFAVCIGNEERKKGTKQMNKARKLLCLLLVLLMVFPFAVACQKEEPNTPDADGDTNDTSSDDPSASAPTALDVVRDGKIATIVYPSSADSTMLEVVNSLTGALKRITGVSSLRPEVEGKYDASTVEILVGATTYPESVQVYETLGYGEGVVCVVGNKIVIAGYDASACNRTISSFIVALSGKKDENGNITLMSDYTATVSDRPLVSQLPTMPQTFIPRFEDMGQNCARLVFEGVSVSDVTSYLPKLTAAGYTKHAENQIDNNLYYTYYNTDSVVTVIYAARKNGMMMISVDPMTATSLVPLQSENTGADATTCTTTFTEVGLYYDDNKAANEAAKTMQNMNGMCYVMRLNDGRFIVMDGGHDTQGHADRLYEILKAQSPTEEIVIAAWFFSHDHGDHVGFFPYFTSKYADKVTVELFIHNFPFTSSNNTVSLMNRYSGAKVIKSHPGQKYYFANAEIEILYTADLYATNVEEMSDTNNASQVFTIKANGTKFMILGDYSENAATMLALYSDTTLKSDVVQIAHHGISGMGTALYEKIRPTYAFWPVAMHADGHVYWNWGTPIDVNLKGRAENAYFFNSMDYNNNVFVANDHVYVASGIANGSITVTQYENASAYLSALGN